MSIEPTRIGAAALLLASSVPALLHAQPAPAPDIELPPERETPAEQTAAAYADQVWTAPKTDRKSVV